MAVGLLVADDHKGCSVFFETVLSKVEPQAILGRWCFLIHHNEGFPVGIKDADLGLGTSIFAMRVGHANGVETRGQRTGVEGNAFAAPVFVLVVKVTLIDVHLDRVGFLPGTDLLGLSVVDDDAGDFLGADDRRALVALFLTILELTELFLDLLEPFCQPVEFLLLLVAHGQRLTDPFRNILVIHRDRGFENSGQGIVIGRRYRIEFMIVATRTA